MTREGNKLILNTASFGVVAVLVFIGMTLALSGGWSTGPNEYVSCGLTQWLELHRYQSTWAVERLHPIRLVTEIGFAVFATWVLSKILYAFRKPS